jgi:hypothetical protein
MRYSLAIFVIAFLIIFSQFEGTSSVFAQQSREQLEQELADLEAQIKALTEVSLKHKHKKTHSLKRFLC